MKRQPPWQAKQFAWPAKSAKPRFAAAGIAASSPSTQASNGAPAGLERALEGGDRGHDRVDVDARAGQRRGELRRIGGV